ncbi:MAG: GxxExxY protein [Acidobacteria bacterium]|nr:GxxExxY protein [Acidobacteriota bacterium]
MNADARRLDEITKKVIGCSYAVANTLGSGFLEKVYENALTYELRKAGLTVDQQKAIEVCYEEIVVGDYVADLVVEDSVLVELKVAKQLDQVHLAQCMNYLAATGLKVCLLINFGTRKVQVKRVVRGF